MSELAVFAALYLNGVEIDTTLDCFPEDMEQS